MLLGFQLRNLVLPVGVKNIPVLSLQPLRYLKSSCQRNDTRSAANSRVATNILPMACKGLGWRGVSAGCYARAGPVVTTMVLIVHGRAILPVVPLRRSGGRGLLRLHASIWWCLHRDRGCVYARSTRTRQLLAL